MGLLDEHGREGMLTLWETVRGQTLPISESVLREACKTHIFTITLWKLCCPNCFFVLFFSEEYNVVYAEILSNLNSISFPTFCHKSNK